MIKGFPGATNCQIKSGASCPRTQDKQVGRWAAGKPVKCMTDFIGRGSWIRTNDLQYPKLPRYQAALYPDRLGNDVDTRLNRGQQGANPSVSGH
jgi:hypothetical protein